MIEHIYFYDKCPPMNGIAGDTFPLFRVRVDDMDLTGCSMRVLLEPKYTPGEVVFTKSCSHYTAQSEEGFSVRLASSDTEKLLGCYTMYFVLTDSNDREYWKLKGTLEVLARPAEV